MNWFSVNVNSTNQTLGKSKLLLTDRKDIVYNWRGNLVWFYSNFIQHHEIFKSTRNTYSNI